MKEIKSNKIEGYETYLIYENGMVYNTLTGTFLRIDNGKNHYKTVRLRKDNKPKTFLVHRLLAKAFIPNPDNKPCVNHIDGNKLNNNLSNLEWCTHQENMRHAEKHGLLYRSEKNIKATAEAKFKPVVNLENGVFYESIKEAAQCLGISSKNLARYLNGTRKNKTNLAFA